MPLSPATANNENISNEESSYSHGDTQSMSQPTISNPSSITDVRSSEILDQPVKSAALPKPLPIPSTIDEPSLIFGSFNPVMPGKPVVFEHRSAHLLVIF